MRKLRKVKYAILIVIATILFVVSNYLGLSGDDLLNVMKGAEADLKAHVQAHPILSVLVYIGIFALSITLFLPFGVPFLLIAGAIFGVHMGAFWASVANLIGATLSFGVLRYFFYDDVQKIIPKKFLYLRDAVEEDGIFYMFVLRIAPVLPSEMINLILALAPVKLIPYMIVTFIARYPINYIYCQLGENLSDIQTWSELFSWNVFLSLIGLIALLTVGKVLYRIFLTSEQPNAKEKGAK